jgi:hypothetical protein
MVSWECMLHSMHTRDNFETLIGKLAQRQDAYKYLNFQDVSWQSIDRLAEIRAHNKHFLVALLKMLSFRTHVRNYGNWPILWTFFFQPRMVVEMKFLFISYEAIFIQTEECNLYVVYMQIIIHNKIIIMYQLEDSH